MFGQPVTRTALSEEAVRKLLLEVWGRQACRNPAHWPDVLARLLKNAPASQDSSPENHGRGSLMSAVDHAVAALALAFASGPPADLTAVVWRAFPKLDRQHCEELAALLAEAAHG